MKTYAFIFAFAAAFASYGQDRRQIPGYTLVWADEFDQDGPLNPDDWGFEQGFVRNNEHQWYQPENAWVENGMLVIEARKERKPNPNYEASSSDWRKAREFIEYTSASVNTRGKRAWQYGRIEVRAKIVASEGLWPAIWTLGVEGEWPSNGEVDIMEYYKDGILANFAWGTKKRFAAKWDSFHKPMAAFKDKDWDDRFHTWVLEWDEDEMAIYLDGSLLNNVDLNTTFNEGDGKNPFRQPHYLLLNLAIGGNNGGNPEKAKYPSRYLIDYVRVYRKD